MTDEVIDPKELKRRMKEEKRRLKELKKQRRLEMKRRKQEMKMARLKAKERMYSADMPAESSPAVDTSGQVAEETQVPGLAVAPPVHGGEIRWVKRSPLTIEEIERRVDALDVTKMKGFTKRIETEHKSLFDLYAERFGEPLEIPEDLRDDVLLNIPEIAPTTPTAEIQATKVEEEEKKEPEKPRQEKGSLIKKILPFGKKKDQAS